MLRRVSPIRNRLETPSGCTKSPIFVVRDRWIPFDSASYNFRKKEKSRFMEKRLLNFGYFCFRNGICELSYICAVQNCFVLCFAVKFCSEKNVLTKEFFSAAVSFQPARCFPLPASPALFSSLTAFGAFRLGRSFSPVWRRVGFSIYDCFLCSGDTFLLRHYGKMPL